MWTVGKLGLLIVFSAAISLGSEALQLGNESFHAHVKANPLALVACKSPFAEKYSSSIQYD